MRKAVLLAVVLGATFVAYTTEASAVVCARGVHRAGCVGPNGAIVARRAGPRATVVRRTTVAPRRGVVRRSTTVIR